MLFMQPVVVNDVDQSTVAEVRKVQEAQMAEPRTAEPAWTDWSGVMLAQSSLDQRSPFGANAVDNNNKVTPGAATTAPVPPDQPSNPDLPGTAQPPAPSSTQPAPPDTTAPGTTTAPPAAAPGTATPSSTPGAAGGTTGTMPAPTSTPPPSTPGNIDQPSSSTFPGASQPNSTTNPGVLPGGSSGASNSR